jgi:hypothetical protein
MTNDQNQTKPELFDVIAKDPTVRRFVTRENHSLFFSLYLRHYIKHPMAEFQKDIIRINKDIINISGATMSVRSMTAGIKRVLVLVDEFYLKPQGLGSDTVTAQKTEKGFFKSIFGN